MDNIAKCPKCPKCGARLFLVRPGYLGGHIDGYIIEKCSSLACDYRNECPPGRYALDAIRRHQAPEAARKGGD